MIEYNETLVFEKTDKTHAKNIHHQYNLNNNHGMLNNRVVCRLDTALCSMGMQFYSNTATQTWYIKKSNL